jgi:eukaryotic-like serine/threonine-protein kinase
MSPERWLRIEEVYHSALERAPNQRTAFLAEICGSDDELRREVESLLRHGESQDALVDRPAWEAAGELLDTHTVDRTRELAGHRISHYEIVEKLGEGGMGAVYKARDTRLGRLVAIKTPPREKVEDPDRKRRFVQEAKAASALNHPNIVSVYDIDQAGGVEFIAMEYVPGKTLGEMIGRKGLSVGRALDYAAQMAGALAAAHAAGIVHRDLKPANVMVTETGVVKLLDFGVAKLTQPQEVRATAATAPVKTEEGAIVGTSAYMSPEQAEGKPVDARSDIFSFGSVLYEMLTGRKAFQTDSKTSTLGAIIHKEPEPLGAWVPHDLEKVITRCLRKDPGRRQQTMADLKIALEELKEESDSGKLAGVPAPSRPRNRRFLRPTLAAAGVLVLAAGGFFLWQRLQAKPLTDKDVLVLADFTNTTGDPVFDGTLREALAVQLEQSPFLKIMGDEQVRQDLRFMGRSAGERITNQAAREICQREGEKAMIGGSIASLGKTYAIALQATNCQTGESMAREQVEAEDKEHVLRALATATTGMRAKLGESLASIEKLAVPNQQVTTTSLEAFQAYALGRAQATLGLSLAAIPFFQRATELDPNFATAYTDLGDRYNTVGEMGRGVEYLKKAFALVDRVSERERLAISAFYYFRAIGELNKAAEALQLWTRTYPREAEPRNMVGLLYASTGDWERALPEYQESTRLGGAHYSGSYTNQVAAYCYLGRSDEAKAVAEKTFSQKLDFMNMHFPLLRLAYVQGNRSEAEKQIQSMTGRPEEYQSLLIQAADAAVLGQVRREQELLRRGGEIARRQNLTETAARYQAHDALTEALVRNCEAARAKAGAATYPDPDPVGAFAIALPLALCGDAAAAQKTADDTSKRYSVHTLWNAVYLPSIRAALELNRNQPEKAIELLKSAVPYERAYTDAVYLRGLAYLRARKGTEAAAEFQKILDHKSATWGPYCPIFHRGWGPYFPLSYVGLARAAALAGDAPRARKAYQDFLALWKDADPDLPILMEAKQEYAKLK